MRSNLSRKRYSSEICPPDSEILIQRIAVEIARWSVETVSCCVSASFNLFCSHVNDDIEAFHFLQQVVGTFVLCARSR